MALPTYKIEIAFNAGVTTPAASRSWTDVTAYVLLDSGIDITYGRGDWRSEADANTLRLTLNNSDGRFTAGRAASPYYPNVKLGRPIRVTATVGGVSSVRFLGFIDEWPLEWPAAVTSFATAQITATSRSAWLSEGLELRSIVEEEILVDGPVAYYTLGEPAGATTASESSGNGGSALTSIPGFPVASFGTTPGATPGSFMATFPANASQLQAMRSESGGPCTIEAVVKIAAAPNNFVVITGGFRGSSSIYVGSAGSPKFGTITASATVTDGALHHVAGTFDGTSIRLYVDGVLQGTDLASTPTPAAPYAVRIGGWEGASNTTPYSIASVAWFNAALSGPRIAAHAAASLTGFAGESPSARITRYASYADIAATELSLDAGQVPGLTSLDTTGTTALDMMRKIEATEEGILFDRADGLLGFHDRAHRYTMTPAFVLDVNQGQVGSGMEPRLDRTTVRNDVTTSSPDGTLTARATNATSISTYGPARESIEVATSNADEPFEHASWLVNQYNDAQPRVPSLTVDLNNLGTTLTQSVLAAAVSTQFTVKNLPSQAAVSSQDYIIEGYSESIGSTRHSITFNISQATPYAVFTIGDPVYGQYDAYPIAL